MNLDRLEKIVWVITAVAVVLVIVFVKYGPFKSGISKETVWDDDFYAINPHLQRGERPNVALPASRGVSFTPTAGAARQPAPGGVPARQPGEAEGAAQPPAPPGGPALRPPVAGEPPRPPDHPGTAVPASEAPAIYIPQSVREKYRYFEDVVELGMTAAGDDVDYGGQVAFQITFIEDNSPLSTRLGFQAGDIVISVNGYPASKANARQLFETLKHESDFRVEIDRGGSRMTIPYHVR